MRRANRLATLLTIGLLQALTPLPAGAAELKVLLPLGRVAYQTNEWIDVSVVRTSADGLKDGTLVLTLTGTDGSKLDFTFAARSATGKPAVATEHLHLNGALLRPGKYRLDVAGEGTTATTTLEVCSHLRGSSFKTTDWASHAAKHEHATLGEDSMGFNLMLYAYGGLDPDEAIRGGLDCLRNCTLGGWHYMDLRRECDWSNPYVLRRASVGLCCVTSRWRPHSATAFAIQERMDSLGIGVDFFLPLMARFPALFSRGRVQLGYHPSSTWSPLSSHRRNRSAACARTAETGRSSLAFTANPSA
jgi:hypothetical protein